MEDHIEKIRAWILNSDEVPEEMVTSILAVCDAAENQDHQPTDYFTEF